jgi:hypothetical protein
VYGTVCVKTERKYVWCFTVFLKYHSLHDPCSGKFLYLHRPHETGQSNLPGHTVGRDNLDAREAQWQMSATTRDDWCMARVAGQVRSSGPKSCDQDHMIISADWARLTLYSLCICAWGGGQRASQGQCCEWPTQMSYVWERVCLSLSVYAQVHVCGLVSV